MTALPTRVSGKDSTSALIAGGSTMSSFNMLSGSGAGFYDVALTAINKEFSAGANIKRDHVTEYVPG